MLDPNTSVEKILEDFPMLKDVTYLELSIMKEDSVESPEDEILVSAIDILIKNMDSGSYKVDDEPELVGVS